MRKIRLHKLLLVVLLLAGVSWGGFRVWLSTQPEDFQAMIDAMPVSEFMRVTVETFVPRETVDYGSYDRRDYPGRGHSPWVLRSSLDGMSRMLHFALAPGYWLSYHTQSGSAYQFWQGELQFQGPVYDTYHGREPFSRGNAYFRNAEPSAWLLDRGDGVQPAEVEYLGHFYRNHSAQAGIRLRLCLGEDCVTLTEMPEIEIDAAGVTLRRQFALEQRGAGDIAVALRLPRDGVQIQGNGRWDPVSGVYSLRDASTELSMVFTEPGIAIVEQKKDSSVFPGERHMPRAMAESDCSSCHNEHEQIVGPSYLAIAERFGNASNAGKSALADKVIKGGGGSWGELSMPPHPGLKRDDAQEMIDYILATEAPDSDGDAVVAALREQVSWSYDVDVEPRPEGLHPALRAQSLLPEGFTPMVGGVELLPDGRLLLVTWDSDGAVYALENWQQGVAGVKRIAEGLQEPLGVAVVDGDIYVMQKQEITRLIDRDGDDWIDEYQTVNDDWQASSNFHEFGFGLVHHQGYLYGGLSACVENGGKSCTHQLRDRGRLFRVSLATGELEFVASGVRTPNGFGLSADGEVFVTDNQGDWLPSSKLLRLQPDAFYGWRAANATASADKEVTAPVLWLPQNEVGNSPTQPLQLRSGRYAGQWIFGDVYNGGIKRGFVEEVDGQHQGAAFHFTAGLQGGVNRLLAVGSGDVIAGEIGNPGNWGDVGKQWYGLERLRFTDEPAFEPLEVRATVDGFSITFSEPLPTDHQLDAEQWLVSQWFYQPSSMYGGPKYDPHRLQVTDLQLSADRRTVSLTVPGLKAGYVVYLRMPRDLRSAAGRPLWTNEAWYTLNRIPTGRKAEPAVSGLTAAEKAAGWQQLFDGESLKGWRNFGTEEGQPVKGWQVENGTLRMVRDTSFARFALNYLNPFTDTPLLDLMTERKYSEFELALEWKISEGGNSGIFYLAPNEGERVAWEKGLEMQVLDNDRHPDGKKVKHRAGDLYDLKSSSSEPVRPVGEWNEVRIRVEDDRIQHWLNGVNVIDVVRGSDEWQALLSASKFADWEGYGQARSGHIVLQDHGDAVWYRNIKILPLGEKPLD